MKKRTTFVRYVLMQFPTQKQIVNITLFHSKIAEFGDGVPDKLSRFCKILSIIFIIETKAEKGGQGHVKCSRELAVSSCC